MIEKDINLILDLVEDKISEDFFVKEFSIKNLDSDDNVINEIIKLALDDKNQDALEMGLILSGFFDFDQEKYMSLLADAIYSPWHSIHELVLDYMILFDSKDYTLFIEICKKKKLYYEEGVFESIKRKAKNYLEEKGH